MGELGIVFLFVIGMALAVAEFFLPGAIMGLIGLVCVLASIYLAFHQEMTVLGWSLVGITIVSVPVFVLLWVKVLNRVLAMKETQQGTTSATVEDKGLMGKEGVALTQLRPSGVARFGDRKVDVVSDGEMIDRDTRVKVIEVRSNRVVVRAVKS